MGRGFWTDERDSSLTNLLMDGTCTLTIKEIAERLGAPSLGAVFQRASRLGLPKRWTKRDEWPTERVERLKELASRPVKMSSKEIAQELGITKSAVIGKCSRLGIKLPLPPHSSSKPRPRTSVPRAVKRLRPTEQAPEPRHIPLLELEGHQCRWPYGDGPYTFCGHEKARGHSYCEFHVSRAFGYVPEKRPVKHQFGTKENVLRSREAFEEAFNEAA